MKEMLIGSIASTDLGGLDEMKLVQSLNNPRTVVVPDHWPALEVARLAEKMKAHLIITIDATKQIKGVISPPWVLRQFHKVRDRDFTSFTEALTSLAQDPSEQVRDYHHEWLTEERVDLYLCPMGHYTSSKPCSEHKM